MEHAVALARGAVGARKRRDELAIAASAISLFWTAFVLTRPFGATFGVVLTKPLEDGGFNLSRIMASLVLAGLTVTVILVSGKRAERTPLAG